MATGNLKSCFGVGNVNFRCMKVWRSYHVAKCRQCKFSMYESVAKLPCGEVTVAKLPCGEVTGSRRNCGAKHWL